MSNTLRTADLPARGSDAALGERPERNELHANDKRLD
jgi:hypothetical protein